MKKALFTFAMITAMLACNNNSGSSENKDDDKY